MPSDPSGIYLVQVRQLMRELVTTRPGEMDCPECYEHMDRFADLILSGADTTRVMPRLQEHLERCAHCREEFEALLAAVRSLA
jgi:hypothetical protein